jgi:hypothetical protein
MANKETYPSPALATMSDALLERGDSKREKIAEKHAADSGPITPSRAEFATLIRSPTMWGLLYLPLLLVLAVVAYMVDNLRPGPGRVYGSGDGASPNAQSGDK